MRRINAPCLFEMFTKLNKLVSFSFSISFVSLMMIRCLTLLSNKDKNI